MAEWRPADWRKPAKGRWKRRRWPGRLRQRRAARREWMCERLCMGEVSAVTRAIRLTVMRIIRSRCGFLCGLLLLAGCSSNHIRLRVVDKTSNRPIKGVAVVLVKRDYSILNNRTSTEQPVGLS